MHAKCQRAHADVVGRGTPGATGVIQAMFQPKYRIAALQRKYLTKHIALAVRFFAYDMLYVKRRNPL